MKIYSNISTVILDIDVDDNSFRYRSIMGDYKVVLYFSLPESIEIPVGSYIEFQGQKYTLFRPEHLKKNGTRKFDYEITFGSNLELLKQFKYKFLSTNPFKLKFPLTAKPERFLRLLVENLNINDSGWHIGEFIEASEKEISFNHDDCFSVLSRIAGEFDTEWEIEGKTIHLRKVEHNKDYPLALSYGKGNGFRVGVGRSNNSEKRPVTILYVQGGERNINKKEYGSETLRLPIDQTITFEGRTYKTDIHGMSIQRTDKPLTSMVEDSYDGSQFYPKHVGSVTSVELEHSTDDEGNPVVFYDIIDSNIPESLDYSKYTMDGEKATIIFQSGMLAGKEFQIMTDENGKLTGYDHNEKRFKLVSNDTEGGRMPNETFCPKEGDSYAVFHIQMPLEYIGNASWDMFHEAVRYMYENEEELFTFTGELDPIWASQNWLSLGGKIIPGGYVLFSDNQFQPEGIKIRITGVTDYINRPHQPNIELSNSPVAGYLSNDVKKLQAQEVVNDSLYNNAIQYTKRRFRDAVETQKMLEEAVEGFEAGINPIWVKTMSLLAGSEDLQFRFIKSKSQRDTPIIPNFVMNNDTKVFRMPEATLQHMTLGIDQVTYKRDPLKYKVWTVLGKSTAPLDEPNKPYYLYAICPKTMEDGYFDLKAEAHKVDAGSEYYFLVGTLSSEQDGERSYTSLYGFTEILPGRITTKSIVSDSGTTYFNLETGEIGGVIKFSGGSTGYNNIADKPNLEEIKIENAASYLKSLKTEKANIDALYLSLYQNSLLTGTDKNNLYSAKNTLDSAYNNLVNYINTAISDGVITVAERNTINSRYEQYNSSLGTYLVYYRYASSTVSGNTKSILDTKARVFYNTPNNPPSEATKGDLWVDGVSIYQHNGSSWSYHSKYNTQTVINGGLITTGALTVGTSAAYGTGGIAGGGSIRIWSGGYLNAGYNVAPSDSTFRVYENGAVVSRSSFKVEDANKIVNAGFQSEGTNATSVRLWVGSSNPNTALFRVTHDGKLYAKEIEIDSNAGISGTGNTRLWIGGTSTNAPFRVSSTGKLFTKEIEIDSNAGISGAGDVRLWIGGATSSAPFRVLKSGKIYASNIEISGSSKLGAFDINSYSGFSWKGVDYFGGTEFSLQLGTNKLPVSSNVSSIIYAGSSTANNACCVAGIVSVSGVGIYGSSDGYGSNFPAYNAKFAGFFSGSTKTTGTTQSGLVAAQGFRYITDSYLDGQYKYYEGISFDPQDYDLDDIRLRVRGGIIIGVTKDNGTLLKGV